MAVDCSSLEKSSGIVIRETLESFDDKPLASAAAAREERRPGSESFPETKMNSSFPLRGRFR